MSDHEALFTALGDDVPLVLLPVRIETSFHQLDSDAPELRVRVYPDDIHIDTHEPELTDTEATWGRDFWERTWRAAGNEDRRRRAWEQLAERFGPRRAAWIAQVLNPEGSPPTAELPPGEPVELEFPDPPGREDSWTRAPRARALPDRWVALGYRGGECVVTHWGEPVDGDLAVGPDPDPGPNPDPTVESDADADEEPPLDSGMRWLVDFDAAVGAGMGLRVPLPLPADEGLDRLLVVGVRASANPEASAAQLEALLEAQHHTRGLEFVPQGTPTNHTPDGRAGTVPGRSLDETARLFSIERGPDLVGEGSDGDLTASALGISSAVFAHVAGADGHEQQDVRHMNAALWPATFGYFLEQMMAETFAVSEVRAARRHFIDHVRGRGPLPTLRVGDQPYGLLPIQHDRAALLSIDGGAPPVWRESLQTGLRQVWRDSLDGVPRAGDGANPDQTLLRILGADATSSAYAARGVRGMSHLQHLFSFLGVARAVAHAWRDNVLSQSRSALEDVLGEAAASLDWDPRLAWCLFDGVFELAERYVSPTPEPGLAPGVAPLEPNYVRWLRKADHAAIRSETFDGFDDFEALDGEPPDTLLYLLLRHSVLLSYGTAAHSLLAATFAPWREPELVDIGADDTPTLWRLLAHALPDGQTEAQSDGIFDDIAAFLDSDAAAGSDDEAVQAHVELHDALAHLEQQPVGALRQLLHETLDLSAHRLDAWITSVATARLEQLRGQRQTGLHLGGYGWVEDVRPAAAGPSAGHVLAPSLAHGLTAAVLHNEQLVDEPADTVGDADLRRPPDLSSERVRVARWLLAGVRQGQPLGALLGYRFERGLRERAAGNPGLVLAPFTRAFRELAPFVDVDEAEDEGTDMPGSGDGQATDAPEGQAAEIAAAEVVDGLKLARGWQRRWRFEGIPFTELDAPSPGPREAAAITAELRDLAAAADAVADAVLAESVYQTAQGNTLRTGASLDAMNRGEAQPPDLEVARTPRTGVASTHRLLVWLDSEPGPAPRWAGTPRAEAEPRLNAWAARLLADPAAVRFRARYLDPAIGEEFADPGVVSVALADITAPAGDDAPGLAPLDLLELVGSDDQDEAAALQRRLVDHLLVDGRPSQVPEGAQVRLLFDRDPDWGPDTVSVPELLMLARGVRDVITDARALASEDLQVPGDPDTGALDVDALDETVEDIAARSLHAIDALRSARDHLAGVQEADDARAGELRAALYGLAAFDVAGAVPVSAPVDGSHVDKLVNQARTAERAAGAKLDEIDSAEESFDRDTASPREAIEHDRRLLRLVFGAAFRAVPLLVPPAMNELARTLHASDAWQGDEPLAAVTWCQRAARVREPVGGFYDLLLHAEAVGAEARLHLEVGQLPHREAERWVALPGDGLPKGGRLSLVVHPALADPDDARSDLVESVLSGKGAGLLIDEWVEVVPRREETAAATFHFEEPGARPPQAVLLALPVDGWDLDEVADTVLEALELARLRMVDPDALDTVGHYLPGLYFALNTSDDTVSADFTRLADHDSGGPGGPGEG